MIQTDISSSLSLFLFFVFASCSSQLSHHLDQGTICWEKPSTVQYFGFFPVKFSRLQSRVPPKHIQGAILHTVMLSLRTALARKKFTASHTSILGWGASDTQFQCWRTYVALFLGNQRATLRDAHKYEAEGQLIRERVKQSGGLPGRTSQRAWPWLKLSTWEAIWLWAGGCQSHTDTIYRCKQTRKHKVSVKVSRALHSTLESRTWELPKTHRVLGCFFIYLKNGVTIRARTRALMDRFTPKMHTAARTEPDGNSRPPMLEYNQSGHHLPPGVISKQLALEVELVLKPVLQQRMPACKVAS